MGFTTAAAVAGSVLVGPAITSTVGSALLGSDAAGKASDAQEDAAERAAAVTLKMYRRNRKDLAPWRKAGKKALGKLERKIKKGPGEFTEDPGYQFRLAEGEKGIERRASASGGLISGKTLKALNRYNQDYASNEYNNFLNRYYASLRPYENLAGVGQTSAAGTARLGTNAAGTVADAYYGAGQARASGYIDQANVWTNAINQGLNTYAALAGG